jgi:hypothetical protein
MNQSARRELVRLVKILTIAGAIVAAALVHAAFRPRFEALQGELADAGRQLRSDEVTAAELSRLTRRKPELAARYATAFNGHAQAVFLRELARTLNRRHLALTSTSAAPGLPPDGTSNAFRSAFAATRLSLELHGAYRDIVDALVDLSNGSELVRVEVPSFHRADGQVSADVPVTLYDPSRPASAAPLGASPAPLSGGASRP